MTTSRRAFMKGAATLPVAAAAGALGAEAAPLAAVPAATSPYVEYPWQWFVSHDAEIYHEVFDTMAQAVEHAKKCEYRIVAECRQQDFDLSIEGWRILDLINDDNEEARGEGDGIACTDAQEDDLGKMVTAAVEAWAVKHKINITAWSFGGVRNLINVAGAAGEHWE